MIRRITMVARGLCQPLQSVLGFASILTIAAVLGVPSGARAGSLDPNLYIVSQDPDGTDNALYSVNLNVVNSGLFTSYTSIALTSTNGLSTQIRGLAYDNNNGIMYGITAPGNLVTVNLHTGAETLLYTLPSFGSNQNFWSGLAFDGKNNLYVANAYGNHQLVDIPVNSPSSAFVVGNIANASFGGYQPQTLGLALYPASAPSSPPTFNGTDPAPGVLYGSDRGTDSMNTISTSTANATQLNPSQGTTGVSNLQESVFGPNTGLLYTIHDHASASDDSDIAIYNFKTGTETVLGQLPFGIDYDGPPGQGDGNYGAGGMGFGPASVPEPGSLVLLSTGLSILLGGFFASKRKTACIVSANG